VDRTLEAIHDGPAGAAGAGLPGSGGYVDPPGGDAPGLGERAADERV
jgi:hypothetical protein